MRIVCEDPEGRVVDLHAMRTTLGTNLARAGVAPQLAQRIMRHADYRTTHKHYTVLSLTDTAKAIERLPAIKQPFQQTAKANGTTGECLTDDPQQSGREVAQSGATRCDEPSKKPPSGGSRKSGGGRTLRDRVRPNAALRNKAGEGTRTLNIQLGRLNAQPATTAESTTNKQGCTNPSTNPSNTPSNAENSTPSDVDLCLVTQAWQSLPKVVRAAIVGMVEGVTRNVRGE